MFKAILATVVLVSYGLYSTANAGGYVGVDYSMISTGITDHTGYNLKVGYAFNDFFSVEAKGLVGASNETYSDVSIKIDSLYTVAIKASLPLTDSLGVHALYGHSKGEITGSYMGYSESVDDNSSSFGFGASYSHLEAYTVTVEYVELFEDIDAFNIGLNLNF